jgi:hypothetical protein
MAATAVYANVVRVPIARGDVDDWKNFQNINSTTAAFSLDGGTYCYAVKASTYGTVTLQILLPDGTTWATAPVRIGLPVVAGATPVITAADGAITLDLPPGQYRIAIA